MTTLLPLDAGERLTGEAVISEEPAQQSIAVVVPTVARPKELSRCLESLAAARQNLAFPVYVCDSSRREADRAVVREVCARHEWVTLSTHSGSNVAAARNACAKAAAEELLINVDDDLQLEPDAIDRLVARYAEGSGPRIVAGSLNWDGSWTTPKKIRDIGYARPVADRESPDFVIGGFFLYPRAFAIAWPWNERIDTSDDIFIGAVWRSHGVEQMFAGDARAYHPALPTDADPSRIADAVHNQRWHIYALLFDSVLANPNLRRTVAYETLGFAASARLYLFKRRWAIPFLRSWAVGHLRLFADRRYLRGIVKRESLR
jgi:glycosyltransferase involved in cell wall biosynthesis